MTRTDRLNALIDDIGRYRREIASVLNGAELAYRAAETDTEKARILDQLMIVKAAIDKEHSSAKSK